jgi:hypothetical protein
MFHLLQQDIHKGAAGTNGSVVFHSQLLHQLVIRVLLSPEQEADLMTNLYYVNLHSSTFAGGEIRSIN